VIGGLVKSNFPVRIVGRVVSPEDAKVATGLARTGAERLQGEGDFVVVARGQVTRMQAAYIGVVEVEEMLARPRTGTTRRQRLRLLAGTGAGGRGRRGR
jgi:S-DNA-T family DNA segregation ATPase FtsK/SpoIIIE